VSNSKDIRKQIRNVMQAEALTVLTQETMEAIRKELKDQIRNELEVLTKDLKDTLDLRIKDIAKQVSDTLESIAEHSKDIQAYVLRQNK